MDESHDIVRTGAIFRIKAGNTLWKSPRPIIKKRDISQNNSDSVLKKTISSYPQGNLFIITVDFQKIINLFIQIYNRIVWNMHY